MHKTAHKNLQAEQLEEAKQLYQQWLRIEDETSSALSGECYHAIRNKIATIKLCSDLFTGYGDKLSQEKRSELLSCLINASQDLTQSLPAMR